ncbi:hypothetical protein NOV72_04297 [Caballeronia novacaledonica]|uniref:Uncharacterized protein n=1 Tax=Caballeronia novacaledonica TaxID=1544861 RepID=A0A2U3IA93_9BURK|nr:hypothetical protein NOV72_04297 [Caballeronia novacaledonica]
MELSTLRHWLYVVMKARAQRLLPMARRSKYERH